MNIEYFLNLLNNGSFDVLSANEKLILLKRYLPIGMTVSLKSSDRIKFVDSDIKKSKIIGYTDDIKEDKDRCYMLLILEDDITDCGQCPDDGTIHPIHIIYDKKVIRNYKINYLYEQLKKT